MLSPRSAYPFVPRLRNLCERIPICACAARRQARPLGYQARVLTSSSSQRSSTRRSSQRSSTRRSSQRNSFDATAHKSAPAERSLTSRTVMVVACLGAVLFYFSTSQRVPVTGRRRFSFLSDGFVEYMYANIGDDVVQMVHDEGGHFLPDWDPRTTLVKRVMRKLIPVSGLPDLNWEISVVANNSIVNAFVYPGGKVVVYSGLISMCGSEDALAAVLGHEIAHTTASHAAERMSAAWLVNFTAGSLSYLLAGPYVATAFALWRYFSDFDLAAFLCYLPMGRKQEVEADYVGLMMMAEACYNPRLAVGFWQRAEAMQRAYGVECPEFLSTHPSEWMPLAMQKRAESDCKGTAAFADRFRIAMRTMRPLGFE
ncbi:uncharacterized protein CPUR_01726 [Claviceps purpurea 20.1]|uniref:Peptidase M48 domain-containing protein n=1 Tax=Claviceps purpurea (strain 20.1) TaxID=1111077 RepID=M1VUR9_CLAP2|nr:uncharacterized protein CPUR_01726 [Claviceps purpurea 20.1]